MQRVLVGSAEVYEITGTSPDGARVVRGARLDIDAQRVAQQFIDDGAVDVHIECKKTKRYLVTS